MFGRKMNRLTALGALLLLSSCALHRDKNPHNDVLVFATQTKLGIDVGAPLNNATLPQFNIGYNRSEAVWMPLRPSGEAGDSSSPSGSSSTEKLRDCQQNLANDFPDFENPQAFCVKAVLPTDKYVSTSTGVKNSIGGTGLEVDTYSVFASFGARGSFSGSDASGGLAQVFATGIAAQRLATNPQVGQVLNEAAPAAQRAQAEVKVAEEQTKQRQLERFGNQATQSRLEEEKTLMGLIDDAWTCGDPAQDQQKFEDIIEDAGSGLSDQRWRQIGSAKTKDTALDLLNGSTTMVMTQFLASLKSQCGE